MVRPFQEGETPLTRAEIMIQGIRKLNEVILERHDKPFYELTEEDRFRFYKNLKMRSGNGACLICSVFQLVTTTDD